MSRELVELCTHPLIYKVDIRGLADVKILSVELDTLHHVEKKYKLNLERLSTDDLCEFKFRIVSMNFDSSGTPVCAIPKVIGARVLVELSNGMIAMFEHFRATLQPWDPLNNAKKECSYSYSYIILY